MWVVVGGSRLALKVFHCVERKPTSTKPAKPADVVSTEYTVNLQGGAY